MNLHSLVCLVGGLFGGYAMPLDSIWDVGCLHCSRGRTRKVELMLNSIGPVWDGNEVLAGTGGGAIIRVHSRRLPLRSSPVFYLSSC